MRLGLRGLRLAEVWLALVMSVTAGVAQRAAVPAVPVTAIVDTVYRADGTAASGTVLISWPAFAAASGIGVPAGSTAVAIGADGVLDVNLVPNAGATPMGSYYTVVYHLDDGSTTREYWVVPVSVGALKVSAIRSTVLPASVAMQTVSKSYVDTAIALAVTGHPLDASTPYVVKTGDTMTGPLVLPGDPTAPLQAADKQYVDEQVTGLAGGQSGKVALDPQGTQVVTQPAGTDLEVNKLNGLLAASQYATGNGSNGIANAAATPDCANGCAVAVEPTYAAGSGQPAEMTNTVSLPDAVQVTDLRNGMTSESHHDPLNTLQPGNDAGHTIDVVSTQTADAILAATGATQQFSSGLVITSEALAGGSNAYPKGIQSAEPFGKSTYSALNMMGTNNTMGQHILAPWLQNCYGVGDCLMGSLEMNSSGGFRDDADEGAHPFDYLIQEDTQVFDGTCGSGCTTGATTLQVNVTGGGGTEGEGRYLIDMNPAKVVTTGALVGGGPGAVAALAEFSGTNFPVSVFLQTAQTVPTQANSIAPGTVTVAINTSAVPAGFATNTAALASATGVMCVLDAEGGLPQNYESAAYTVVDGNHVQLTLKRPHALGATLAAGGMCGYGLEQTVDTVNGIRQVFAVVGSSSATELLYNGASTPLVGLNFTESAYVNYSLVLTGLVRANGVVSVTAANNTPVDLNGLTMQISGAADPSYDGSFVVSTTGQNTFTYNQAGANSSTTGATGVVLTGGYALYPMAEVVNVYNAASKRVDGVLTLAANTADWAPNDAVEEPHYFQQRVAADVEFVTQYMPRARQVQSAGLTYDGNNGPGLYGYAVTNAVPASAYYGNGGTHSKPASGLYVGGIWDNSVEVEAGETAVMRVHCNSHTCGRWNSGYDLFNLDAQGGVDKLHYEPGLGTMTVSVGGAGYVFSPQALTAGTINVGTLNAGKVNGQFTGQFSGAVVAGAGFATTGPMNFPERGHLLGEYLLNEGKGNTAHDTSGLGNDGVLMGTNGGPAWEGSQDLDFEQQGEFVQLPVAVNGAKAWQFAMYAPPFGSGVAPQAQGYGFPVNFGANPSILCGTDYQHLCLIAGRSGKSLTFQAYTTDETEAGEPITAGWHVVTLLCGSNVNGVVTKTRILYDGAEVGSYARQGDAGTCGSAGATGNYQLGGSSVLTGTWFLGKLGAAWAWDTPLSLQEGVTAAKSAMAYLQSKGVQTEYRKVTQAAPVIVAGLDSRTYGVMLTQQTVWLAQMQLNDASYTRVNLGVSGTTTYDMCAMFDATFGGQLGADSGPAIAMLWGGVNDFLFTVETPRQVANNLRCMVQKAKAAGARVVLATEVSSVGNAPGTAASPSDADKNALDTILRAEAFGWGVDNLADLATDPHLGADGASANTQCFPDMLHPGPNCEPYVTAMMQNAVNELTGSTERMRNVTAAATYQETAADRFLDLTGSGAGTGAQNVTLPDCTGYSLTRQVLNLGAVAAGVSAVSGQTLSGSGVLGVGARGVFAPVPGALATGGCRWERVE